MESDEPVCEGFLTARPNEYSIKRHLVHVTWNPVAGVYQCDSCRASWSLTQTWDTRDAVRDV